MSDFDKEAERERLREQYEREQERREATEQMSDLLLKGATMTNAHCDNCGDPIFRYEGTEFCPTCQQAVGEVDEGSADQSGTDEADEGSADQSGADEADARAAGEDAAVASGDETADSADSAAAAGESTATGNGTADGDAQADHIEVKRPSGPAATTADRVDEVAGAGSPQSAPDQSEAGSESAPSAGTAPQQSTDPSAQPTGQSPGQTARTGGQHGDVSIGAARESLVRTLVSQARQAEAAADPRQAADHLEAARTAAETLAALSS